MAQLVLSTGTGTGTGTLDRLQSLNALDAHNQTNGRFVSTPLPDATLAANSARLSAAPLKLTATLTRSPLLQADV